MSFQLILVATTVTVLVQDTAASFMFEFRLTSLATHRNCFGDDITISCETYLSQFCLRQSDETRDCSLGSSGRFGPGGSLPITRQITSSNPWPVSFQLFIRARDEDNPGRDDDLDDIFINRSRQPNSGFSQEEEYFGVKNDVSIRLSYRITCQTNFYGSDCATFCLAQNDDFNGHYTCNSDGSLQCRDGYENPSNSCRDRITACSASPCQQDAQCTPIGLTDYSCDCPDGFTGKSCEVEINECDGDPCQNNGTCFDLINYYSCACVAGYTGKNCSIDIDDCAGVECPGNSTCVDEVNSYTCQEDCRSVTCPNNSICVQTERTTGDYECICDSGFSQQDDKCIQMSTTAIEPGTDVPVNRDRPQVAPATVGTVVAVVVISVAIGILIVMLIVVILLKRRKSKSYNQYPGDSDTKAKFKALDNPIYDLNQPMLSSHNHQQPTLPNSLIYAAPTSPNAGATIRAIDNVLYEETTSRGQESTEDNDEDIRDIQNPVYGDTRDGGDGGGNCELYYSIPKHSTEPETHTDNLIAGTVESSYAKDGAVKETSMKGDCEYAVVDKTKKKKREASIHSPQTADLGSSHAAYEQLESHDQVRLSEVNGSGYEALQY